jgi:hypothetical protein
MPRKFGLDDGSGVLIIGSGAGGGTLGNELAAPSSRQPLCKSTRESLESAWRPPRIRKWSAYQAKPTGQTIVCA